MREMPQQFIKLQINCSSSLYKKMYFKASSYERSVLLYSFWSAAVGCWYLAVLRVASLSAGAVLSFVEVWLYRFCQLEATESAGCQKSKDRVQFYQRCWSYSLSAEEVDKGHRWHHSS